MSPVRRRLLTLVACGTLGWASFACQDDRTSQVVDALPAESLSEPTAIPDASGDSSLDPTGGGDLLDAGPLGEYIAKPYRGDLSTILETRVLRVLTSRNSFDYFIHAGRHGGYQYEMVKAFTKALNRKHSGERNLTPIRFELLPVRSEQLIPMLLAGKGDLIAARMTITEQRAEQVLFSIPYRTVDERLVARSDLQGLEEIRELSDFSGLRISARRSSSYYESLLKANRQLESEGLTPIVIETVDEALETEDVLALVAAGRFPMTTADSIIAETAVSLHPALTVIPGVALREGGRLAWAVHPESTALQGALNAFLPRYREGSLLGNIAVKKYFEDAGQLRVRNGAKEAGGLSPYDDLLRIYADRYDFDWRLMAAVAYQESEFDQSARNRSSATGLFQIKPETAREPYVDIPDIAGEENAANNIHAGIKYLAWIKARYFDSVEGMEEAERIRMALAAYNAGPRTLINARRRAQRMGLDPNIWFQHVELALLEARKTEPVKYVSDINQYYVSYILLGIE